jgi:serine/threonine protein kinase
MTESSIPRCPKCEGPGASADTGGLLFSCRKCAVTFIPTGAGMVGLVQRTAHEPSQLVVDRVPLSAAFTGKYQISRLIGSGGMGTVYLGRDRIQERDVCVKFLYRVEDKELLLRFLREGRCSPRSRTPMWSSFSRSERPRTSPIW